MIFSETKLSGAFLIELEKNEDERGFFARNWSEKSLPNAGWSLILWNRIFPSVGRRGRFAECTIRRRRTDRRSWCVARQGQSCDVIIDLRRDSPTFRQWTDCGINGAKPSDALCAGRFAHGFQSLEDDTEITYQVSSPYHPESSRGVRWNDPAFGIPGRMAIG